jgi:putative serine protease PepD
MPPRAADHRRGSGSWSTAVLVGAVIVAAVGGGVVGGVIVNAFSSPSSSGSTTSSSAGAATTVHTCLVTPVAQETLPSVVTISVQGQSGSGTGSGEVIRSGGYILTNNHVISAAANGGSISVRFSDGTTADAQLTGRDPLTDIAVIKVSGESNLRVIPVGESGKLVIGQPVVVLGAPLGLTSTVTSGIVSALDRTIQVPGEDNQSALLVDAVQTDAAINPGNSGGAMVNCAGQFVGMPTAGATVPSSSGEASGGSIGLGFAIPSYLALRVADEIIATGHASHAYLGLQVSSLSAAAAENGAAEGLLITGIDPSGPAQEAGLRPGDVITTIDGEQAVRTDQLVSVTLTKKPGDKVEIGYKRDGQTATTSVTLGQQPTG